MRMPGAPPWCAAFDEFWSALKLFVQLTDLLPVSISSCTHCYRRVIPLADGSCPNCGDHPANIPSNSSNKVLLGIKGGTTLPQICHNCGSATRRTTRLLLSAEPETGTFDNPFANFLGSFLRVFSIFERMDRISKTIDLGLKVPTCEQCSRKLRSIEPHYVDFEARRIDLVVHAEFKRALEGFRSNSNSLDNRSSQI